MTFDFAHDDHAFFLRKPKAPSDNGIGANQIVSRHSILSKLNRKIISQMRKKFLLLLDVELRIARFPVNTSLFIPFLKQEPHNTLIDGLGLLWYFPRPLVKGTQLRQRQ